MALNNSANLSYIDTGSPNYNLSVGTGAGNVSNSASLNAAFGDTALNAEVTSGSNCAFGYAALLLQNGGTQNCAFGVSAGSGLTSGFSNSAFGHNALFAETSGQANCAFGIDALYSQKSSNNNCAFGSLAGFSQQSYSNCIFIGNGADASANGLTNSIAIGYNSTVSASNTIVIGNGSHTGCVINGIFGQTATSGAAVYITNGGLLGTSTSSLRFKQNIEDMGDNSSRVWDLRPVNFTYKKDPTDFMQWGLIAEEVDKVLPELVNYDDEGNPHNVRYHDLPVILLNEMKKLKLLIEKQQYEIDNLKQRIVT